MARRSIQTTYDDLSKDIGWGTESAKLDDTKARLLDQYMVGSSALDVACATGVYTNYLASKGINVQGVDHNPRLLAIAKKRSPKTVFTKGSIEQLPFPDKSFDTVVAFDILEHVDEQIAFKELIRVTKRRLILTVPQTTATELSDLFVLYGHHIDPTHQRTYTVDSLNQLVKTYRLKKILLEPVHPLSTDALFLAIFSGPLLLRRLLRKICFTFGRPRRFFTNLSLVVDVR